jgi:sugar lactone lactonase YvrE
MSPMHATLELTPFARDFGFLDGLRWHDDALWMSDFTRSEVVRVTLDGAREIVAKVPGEPSGLGFLPNGAMLVVSQQEQRILRLGGDGRLAEHADLRSVARRNANDMIVRRDGTAYVGSFGFLPAAGEAPQAISLARVSPTGEVSIAAPDLMFPNGCVLSADERILYVAETFAHRVTAFDVTADGSLANRRVWAQLGDDAAPDGMCLDSEGAIWMGTVQGERFLRVAEGGEILAVIPTPGQWAISCVFGGEDRETLFCATAQTTLSELMQGSSSAAIYQLKPGVRGAGAP